MMPGYKLRELIESLKHIKAGTSIYRNFKATLRFSWFPVKLDNGSQCWLKNYVLIDIGWSGKKSAGNAYYYLTQEEYGNLYRVMYDIFDSKAKPNNVIPFRK